MKIKCTTLYDITETGVNIRRGRLMNQDTGKQGSQQHNFETVLQCIGIRSQPEEITTPVKEHCRINGHFGTNYKNRGLVPHWTFTFTVHQSGIYTHVNILDEDCNSVPMIRGLEELSTLPPTLNTTTELRNIYFEIIEH